MRSTRGRQPGQAAEPRQRDQCSTWNNLAPRCAVAAAAKNGGALPWASTSVVLGPITPVAVRRSVNAARYSDQTGV